MLLCYTSVYIYIYIQYFNILEVEGLLQSFLGHMSLLWTEVLPGHNSLDRKPPVVPLQLNDTQPLLGYGCGVSFALGEWVAVAFPNPWLRIQHRYERNFVIAIGNIELHKSHQIISNHPLVCLHPPNHSLTNRLPRGKSPVKPPSVQSKPLCCKVARMHSVAEIVGSS